MANNNQPTSFIQQMINQRGQDWIVTMTPENIQKNAKRIVRDIARGFIDYDGMWDARELSTLLCRLMRKSNNIPSIIRKME